MSEYLVLENRRKKWDGILTHPSLFETGIHQYAHEMYFKKNPGYKHAVVTDIYSKFYCFFESDEYVLFYFYKGNPFDWTSDIEKTTLIEIKPHKDTLSTFTLVAPYWYDNFEKTECTDLPVLVYNATIGHTPSNEAFVKSICNTVYEQ